MKLKMKLSMQGAVSINPGDVYECDDAEGGRLKDAGYGKVVPDDTETTVTQPGYEPPAPAPKA